MIMFLVFFFSSGLSAHGASVSFRRSSASVHTGRFKGAWVMTERPVAFPVWQEVRTPTEEILLFVTLLKSKEKGKKRKRESSSGACTDFRQSRGPPPSYVTPTACVTGWVTSVAPDGRRRTGAGKHTRNPLETHWRCTDHFAFPPCSPSLQCTFKLRFDAVTGDSISVLRWERDVCMAMQLLFSHHTPPTRTTSHDLLFFSQLCMFTAPLIL